MAITHDFEFICPNAVTAPPCSARHWAVDVTESWIFRHLQLFTCGSQIANAYIDSDCLQGIRPSSIAKKKELITLRNHKTKSIDEPGITIVEGTNGVLACLYGRIDFDSSPALRERLLALLQDSNRRTVTLDMSAVTHMDSSGIATLIDALKQARGYKTELRLHGLDDRLLHLFEFTGILSLFNGSMRI